MHEGITLLGVCAREPDRIFIGDNDEDLAGPGMIYDDDDHDDEDDLIQRLGTLGQSHGGSCAGPKEPG